MFRLLFAGLLAFAFSDAAFAQQKKHKWKSYPLVAFSIPPGPNDPSLAAFRARLIELAKQKDKAAIEKLLPKDFFYERDHGGSFDAAASPIANLSVALQLDAADDSGWQDLANLARFVPGKHQSRRNVFCGPPHPVLNENAMTRTEKATDSDAFEWAYPARTGVVVRQQAEATSPEVAKLGAHFIYLDRLNTSNDFDQTKHWWPVITHTGRKGFVAPGELLTLLDPRLCFVKRNGTWMIAGYSGGGD